MQENKMREDYLNVDTYCFVGSARGIDTRLSSRTSIRFKTARRIQQLLRFLVT
jgi:hypothetical protein